MNDHELVKRAVDLHDQKAFSELMNRYQESIRIFILRIVQNMEDADDLTNLTFERAFKSLPNYRPDFAFPTWLYTIAKHAAIDFSRKKRPPVQSMQTSTADQPEGREIPIQDQSPNPEQYLIQNQTHARIRALVADLKPDFKQTIELHYFEGLSVEEISIRLSKPIGTVKANLHRARSFLAQKFSGHRP